MNNIKRITLGTFLTVVSITFASAQSVDCLTGMSWSGYLKKSRTIYQEQDKLNLATNEGNATIDASEKTTSIIYSNNKKVPEVTLKVLKVQTGVYGADTLQVLNSLNYARQSDTKNPMDSIELSYNGFTFHGISSKDLSTTGILSTFVLFPGKETIVYITFNAPPQNEKLLENIETFEAKRNSFIGNYSAYLRKCFL